jgi:hypothetical protein
MDMVSNIATEAQLLKTLIKESIREVLKEERLSLFLALIPSVSDKEMKEILLSTPSPEHYPPENFVDMTDWLES